MVAPMSKRRCGVGVVVLCDLLYAVGGHDGQSYLNSIERWVLFDFARPGKLDLFYPSGVFFNILFTFSLNSGADFTDVLISDYCISRVNHRIIENL